MNVFVLGIMWNKILGIGYCDLILFFNILENWDLFKLNYGGVKFNDVNFNILVFEKFIYFLNKKFYCGNLWIVFYEF